MAYRRTYTVGNLACAKALPFSNADTFLQRMAAHSSIPVIDLFAGPGGLGEGFCRVNGPKQGAAFRIALSIEKDRVAHQTLRLRSFYRQFADRTVPKEYYAHLRGEIDETELHSAFPEEAALSHEEAWQAELGVIAASEVDRRIRIALDGQRDWVLIGGPPCQAYSLVGRARTGKQKNEADARHFLYREYLRILNIHRPLAFVMENVKGLLSATVKENGVFERILNDLRSAGYTLHALASRNQSFLPGVHVQPHEFIIRSEEHGVPQARHRIIVVGTRDDARLPAPPRLARTATPSTVAEAIGDLPEVRSTLSRRDGFDSGGAWAMAIKRHLGDAVVRDIGKIAGERVADRVGKAREEVLWHLEPGAEFLHRPSGRKRGTNTALGGWYMSQVLGGVCNHTARSHIGPDLARYLFAACYAEVAGRSPVLSNFPSRLQPNHRSAKGNRNGDMAFADRFRVQLRNQPSTTVVSHISKDGHYFIHPDPTQCRSLTVREAARLQTFPDDYLFKGPRTEQYRQVGNAVPPFLAYQIAQSVYTILDGSSDAGKGNGRHNQPGSAKLEHVTHQGA